MGFHHVAFATNDLEATHRFYTEAMGFTLVKSSVAPTDAPGGWAKHVFYDTGGDGLIAFWDLHDDRMVDFDPALSLGLGLQPWVNHIAFAAADMDDIERRLQRWLDRGHDAMEIDHGWCHSIYTMDPNRVLVEFCTDTAPYTAADREEALRVITAPLDELELEEMRVPKFHKAPARV
jgi:catechol 2,3-dioxygenase-like lactoylglutathione lyase family enzyme